MGRSRYRTTESNVDVTAGPETFGKEPRPYGSTAQRERDQSAGCLTRSCRSGALVVGNTTDLDGSTVARLHDSGARWSEFGQPTLLRVRLIGAHAVGLRVRPPGRVQRRQRSSPE